MSTDLRFREFNALKIWHHADRLRALADQIDVAPITVEVDPVAYCNHHCFWCVDPSHEPVTASLDFLWSLLDELAEFRVNGFRVSGIVFKGGGEPTLHPNFSAILEKTKSLGFEIGVVTNGSRLWVPGLAESLAQHASYVRVSIDGPTPATHYRIHGSHDFENVISGVQRLIQSRKTRHPIVGLSFALDYVLKEEIPETIALGEKTNVDYILIRPPFFEEIGRDSTMTTAQAVELRRALIDAAKAYDGPLDVLVGNWIGDAEQQVGKNIEVDASGRRDYQTKSNLPIEHRLNACWASPLLAVVAANGQVYGCCNLRFLEEWSFGRIDYANGITFSRLWSGMQRSDCWPGCRRPSVFLIARIRCPATMKLSKYCGIKRSHMRVLCSLR
jgi:MoaA/NifB/PqqE/SkfB family radical SAM enzyme